MIGLAGTMRAFVDSAQAATGMPGGKRALVTRRQRAVLRACVWRVFARGCHAVDACRCATRVSSFASRENTLVANRPELVIEFE